MCHINTSLEACNMVSYANQEGCSHYLAISRSLYSVSDCITAVRACCARTSMLLLLILKEKAKCMPVEGFCTRGIQCISSLLCLVITLITSPGGLQHRRCQSGVSPQACISASDTLSDTRSDKQSDTASDSLARSPPGTPAASAILGTEQRVGDRMDTSDQSDMTDSLSGSYTDSDRVEAEVGKSKAQTIAELRDENDWKNSLVLFWVPKPFLEVHIFPTPSYSSMNQSRYI